MVQGKRNVMFKLVVGVDDQMDADVFTGLRSEESMKIIKVPS